MTIYHKHHIVPKHMGGTDYPENIVMITVEQHANLHKQLWEDLGYKEDYIAWQALSKQINLDEAKLLAIELGRKKALISKIANAKPRSEESKEKQRQAMKGKLPWNKGKKSVQVPWNKGKEKIYSIETLEKMKSAAKKRPKPNEETKKKILEHIHKKQYCDCGCNKFYNIGNYTQHRKHLQEI